MFETLLNPIFSPLLLLPTWLAILIISLLISGIIVLFYKKFTDQDLMKRLKTEIKELQAEMKQLKDHPKKMMEVQKKAMQTNMKYMMHSMKPTLFTFIPIIIVFGWLNAHFAYMPIYDNQDFSVTLEFNDGYSGDVTLNLPDGITLLNGDSTFQEIKENKVIWFMKGDPGEYTFYYNYDDKEYSNEVLIVEQGEKDYLQPVKVLKKEPIRTITLSNKKMTPFGSLSIFGYHPGWLMTYIFFSIIFSMGLRKLLKVY